MVDAVPVHPLSVVSHVDGPWIFLRLGRIRPSARSGRTSYVSLPQFLWFHCWEVCGRSQMCFDAVEHLLGSPLPLGGFLEEAEASVFPDSRANFSPHPVLL